MVNSIKNLYTRILLYIILNWNIFQDVGAFSDEKFDAKDWINKAFKSPEALDNNEVN